MQARAARKEPAGGPGRKGRYGALRGSEHAKRDEDRKDDDRDDVPPLSVHFSLLLCADAN